jgi:hypothetical protein
VRARAGSARAAAPSRVACYGGRDQTSTADSADRRSSRGGACGARCAAASGGAPTRAAARPTATTRRRGLARAPGEVEGEGEGGTAEGRRVRRARGAEWSGAPALASGGRMGAHTWRALRAPPRLEPRAPRRASVARVEVGLVACVGPAALVERAAGVGPACGARKRQAGALRHGALRRRAHLVFQPRQPLVGPRDRRPSEPADGASVRASVLPAGGSKGRADDNGRAGETPRALARAHARVAGGPRAHLVGEELPGAAQGLHLVQTRDALYSSKCPLF